MEAFEIDIQEFLKDYPLLKMQYLFFNCFIISSDDIMSIYKRAKFNHFKNLNNIEIYYTPNYLYKIKSEDKIFDIINQQMNKKYYFLKEHIFYYQFLLKCLRVKESKERDANEIIDIKNINEIAYRTLLNRLYLIYDNPEINSINYGINEIFGVPCIYSIMESNILDQIINMKKFEMGALKMEKDKFIQIFGINNDIETQSFIYNKLLISISDSNSSISDEKNSYFDELADPNKINKGIIKIEHFLINLSSELFLFNYIIKQFGKDKLIQIPRMLYFCSLYDDNCRNIYQIKSEKEQGKTPNKNALKCKLMDFCGFIELDGAFKYLGEQIELNAE